MCMLLCAKLFFQRINFHVPIQQRGLLFLASAAGERSARIQQFSRQRHDAETVVLLFRRDQSLVQSFHHERLREQMICDLSKSILGLDERICPADHAAIAPKIDFTRLTHCNCRQWKECDTSAVFALQIGYGSLCRVRVLCDNISHTPTERNIDCCKIALWYTNEIGNRSGNTSAPPLRRLQDNLHIPPESLIAVLHTSLKIETLTDAKEFRLRFTRLYLITLDCSAQFFGFTI